MSEFILKLNEARQTLPLKRLMENHGRGPTDGNWKLFPKCHYCGGEQCAGLFEDADGDLFSCRDPRCRSGTAGNPMDEIGFLAFELNVDRTQAARVWLEEAGQWTESFQKHLNQAHSSRPTSKDKKTNSGSGVENAKPCADRNDDTDSPSKSPVEVFVERASLSEADRQELKVKRGLSDEMIDGSGFISNDQSNLAILEGLASKYPGWELAKCGIYKRELNVCRPSGQFFGHGVVGKKKRLPKELLESGDFDDFDDDEFVWAHKDTGLCNPILIPYFDLSGKLIGLRPHKGFPKGQKPQLYLAGGRHAVQQCKQAVIVEGEFKASALQDIVGKDWAVASVPGINQVKNPHVWAGILIWLKRIGAKTVVMAFDGEDHGNPKLPSFRPQLEDRFDAEIWSRVGAVRLEGEGIDSRVAHLPVEWQNENGKADWDSALAAMLLAGKPRSEIRSAFEGVLQSAVPVAELNRAKIFDAAAEKIISDRVAVLTYEPALPWGGPAERKLAAELRQLATGKLREWAGRIVPLAEAYEHTSGWYYELRITDQRREKLELELRDAETTDQMLFLRLALKGTPSRVASFRIDPHYILVKPDGKRDRLVKLTSIRGEKSGLVALDENSFTAARDWRRWLASVGNYGWEKGDGPLQALARDINFKLARREVTQLVAYGCERSGGLWFLDDCAYAEDGTVILPDGEGIYWHKGRGYTFLRDQEKIPRGEEGQSFRLKSAPRMQPGMGLVFDKSGALQLQAGVQDDPDARRELLGNFIIGLNDSYGAYEGSMLIGATMGYFAGPEIYAERGEFPGIWITGAKGGGKTYTSKWLLALHGFSDLEAGLSFKTSSAVGIQIAMGQYANMPVWGDEYKENELRDLNVKGVIHGGFNREVPSKWSADGRARNIRTNFLVTGETTCNNAATMSRFISTVAAREKRKGSPDEQLARLNWLQDHRKLSFVIGRAALQRRAAFALRVREYLAIWERLPELAQTDPRGRFSYGVAFAAFQALNEIIPVQSKKECAKFQKWLIEKAQASARDAGERVELSVFWKDLVSMNTEGLFGRTPDEVSRFFKVMKNKNFVSPFSKRQAKDELEDPRRTLNVPILAIRIREVLDLMSKWKRSQGSPPSPSQSDLQGQMRVHGYFVSSDKRQGHQMKFGRGAKNNSYCWLFDLAKFAEFGLHEISDEEWIASFYRDEDEANGLLPHDEWTDPRKGELFAFVHALEGKQSTYCNSQPMGGRQIPGGSRVDYCFLFGFDLARTYY